MASLYHQYKESLKDIAVEEQVDLFVFRPIAFVVVKAIYRLPITPNQVSVLSMLAGIAAGIFYAGGSRKGFLYGGLFYILAHVLDCCDGMIARLKKNGTLIGRIVDGWSDYVTSVAVYIGLLIGLHNSSLQLPVASPWLIMIPVGISLVFHCIVVDYYRHEFLAHGLGKANTIREDLEIFSKYLETLKKEKRNYLEILLITFYLGYTKLQVKENNGKEENKKYSREAYYNSNKQLLFWWNWIGAASHIFVLAAASLFYQPMIFFVYVLVLANIWMMVMGVVQLRTNKRISIKKNVEPTA
ncbi:MAG: CDP-alcohol phosphatidyltransferase family protein [bacterium]|nr:CDP-alcohol phosphatidyltransferase family protein [bacterium]